MFEIEMLPAREGDCLWIRYGDAKKPRQILIDGGRAATARHLKARLATLPRNQQTFELLVITHVDRDHIEGTLQLLEDPTLAIRFKDIWFNGYDHLQDVKLETFGAVQAERVTTALLSRALPWNKIWKRKAVCLGDTGLSSKKLDGGMTLTLLSPDRKKLTKLIPVWEKECKKAGIIPGAKAMPAEARGLESFGLLDIDKLAATPFRADPGEPNGSSIALLAQYDGKSALLGADAHADRVIESIKLLKKSERRLKVDLFKIAHHGSDRNTSMELLRLLNCRRFLVSTNGSYFQHPAPEAIARIIKFGGKGATLYFNYRTKFTQVWDQAGWRAKYGYAVKFPDKKENGTLRVSL